MWNWITGIIHGAVVLPTLFGFYVATLPHERWELDQKAESLLTMPLFQSEWIRTNSIIFTAPEHSELRAYVWLEQSGCAVLGFLLKVGVSGGRCSAPIMCMLYNCLIIDTFIIIS